MYTISALIEKETVKLASRFNFTYRYIDDILSINPDFENVRGQMYPVALKAKDTTENITSAS